MDALQKPKDARSSVSRSDRLRLPERYQTVEKTKSTFGTTLGVTALRALSHPALASQPPPMKITDIKFLRLRYSGTTPRKRNATMASGGGAPGMTQLEIYTDAGIVGRSIPSGSEELIQSQLLPRILGMNPFHVEPIWDRIYWYNRKSMAKGLYISAMESARLDSVASDRHFAV
jgi:hypothetical protein